MVDGGDRDATEEHDNQYDQCPSEAGNCFLREATAADGDALLSAQEWRFLFRVQVEQSRVI